MYDFKARKHLCLAFSNSEIERMFSQFKLTKRELRISLNDDTIEGLMLWKMNSDLLDINDEKILQKIWERYVELFEKTNLEIYFSNNY